MRMRKGSKKSTFVRVAAVVIALCMIAALAIPAFAAGSSGVSNDDPYTYTVRIFPGDKGTIDDSTDPFIKKEVPPGYQWDRRDFDYRYQAKSNTAKYYVSGMRESGKDNNTNKLYAGGAFTVDRDIDLVISYAIRGSEAAYTIHYVEYGTNVVLRDPETFYGNVGEKPVVSYLYVEGYIPQYKNITATLQADASKNDWTFYYVRREPVQVETASTETNKAGNSGTTITTTGKTTSRTTTSSRSTSTSTTTSSGTSTSGTRSSGTSSSGSSTGSGTSTSNGNSTGSGTSASSGNSTGSGTSASSGNSTGSGTSTSNGNSTGAGTASGSGNNTGVGTASGSGNNTGTAAASGSGNNTGSGTSTGNGNSTGSGAAADNGNAAAGGSENGTAAGNGNAAGTGTGSNAGAGTGTGTPLASNTGTQTAGAGTVNTQQNGPQEIVDVDEQQTPLAEYGSAESVSEDEGENKVEAQEVNPETEGVVRAPGMSTAAKVALGVVIIAILAGAGWFLFRRFASEDDEDEEDEE